jgi:hypothetical protein
MSLEEGAQILAPTESKSIHFWTAKKKLFVKKERT